MMKTLIIASTLLFSLLTQAKVDVVYGVDNRKDTFETTNLDFLIMAESTAGLVRKTNLMPSNKANFFDASNTMTLERANNLCPNEKFASQRLLPICSGFLVGPDTIVTAGHCYNSQDLPENVCQNFAWVFGYEMKSAVHDPTKDISISDIYHCKKVVAVKRDFQWDYAVIKLDRKVTGRSPLKFRTSGKIENNASLVVVGHPDGLPMKIADGGKVTYNAEETRFSTTLDTFHGNSGSPVFNVQTGVIEGILIMGKNDYSTRTNSNNGRSCTVVNVCDENAQNCTTPDAGTGTIAKGEVVLRIEKIAQIINQALLSL